MQNHDTIVILSKKEEYRKRLRSLFEERYNLLETTNGKQALLLLEQNEAVAAAVLVDSPSFLEVVEAEEYHVLAAAWAQKVPVIVITEEKDSSSPSIFFHSGAADVIPISYDGYALYRKLENIVRLHWHERHLQKMVSEQSTILRNSNDTLISILTSMIEYQSLESGHHVKNVCGYTRILLEEVMRQCPEYQLNSHIVDIVSSAASLHDIGKIAIPDSILLKAGPLDADEWTLMKTHAAVGAQILEELEDITDQEYLQYASNICHYHHERWDGNGYPEGLIGDEIPVCAQVVGLADVFEALTSKRAYKKAFSFEEATHMILQGECGVFAPQLMDCFKNTLPLFRELLESEEENSRETGESVLSAAEASLQNAPVKQAPPSLLEKTKSKYYTLVHYIQGFLIEVNLDQKVFHIVYNPYTELAGIETTLSLEELVQMVLDQVAVPEERDDMSDFIYRQIPAFVEDDRRRVTYRFRYQKSVDSQGGWMDITLLRITNPTQRSLALLVKKVPEEELAAADRNPQKFTKASHPFICLYDKDLTLVKEGYQSDYIGRDQSELRERLHGHFLELVHHDDRQMFRRELERQLKTGNIAQVEHRILGKDGSVRWVADRIHLVMEQDGNEYVHCFMTDISKTREAYELLQKRHQQYKEILTYTKNSLFIWDVVKDTWTTSDSWNDMFGFNLDGGKVEELLVQATHVHPDDLPLLLDKLESLKSGADSAVLEIRIVSSSSSYSWYRVRTTAKRDENGRLTTIMGLIFNVDSEKQRSTILEKRAEQDSLTGLLNKEAGRIQIEDYLSYYPEGTDCTLMIIDLDNFKQVNDQYGHLFGDAVLTRVAQEIKNQFRSQDVLCRIGGDEFLIFLRGTSERRFLEVRCRQFIESLKVSLRGEYRLFSISCSVGIALCPEHGTTYYELFRRADQALYQVKKEGKNNFMFYDGSARLIGGQEMQHTEVNAKIDSDEEDSMSGDNFVRRAFHQLYTSTDVPQTINTILDYVGRKMNASRVYIFENTPDNRFCNNTFEWCNGGISPEMDSLQGVSYEDDIPNYEENFDEDGIFYCPDISELPQNLRDILEPQGIQSMLQCAIMENGKFRGYIGFDECQMVRLWTKEEISWLNYLAETIAMFLLRYREQERLRKQTLELQSIMDSQASWLYVIDPKTWELLYLNEKVRKGRPKAQCGQPCYRALMEREVPCEGCPVKKLDGQRSAQSIFEDRRYPAKVSVEAIRATWGGKEQCLVSCHRLSDV